MFLSVGFSQAFRKGKETWLQCQLGTSQLCDPCSHDWPFRSLAGVPVSFPLLRRGEWQGLTDTERFHQITSKSLCAKKYWKQKIHPHAQEQVFRA